MLDLPASAITAAVVRLCREAACDLPGDVRSALVDAKAQERNPLARDLLDTCLVNADLAAQRRLPLCQDTGLAVVFAELGEDLRISGGSLHAAIQAGIAQGYREAHLRASLVADPLFVRKNTGDNTPAVIHLDLVPGNRLRLVLAPKGGGSENMTRLAMLTPSAGRAGVVKTVVEAVTAAGGNPCPPVIVGVGLGGTAERALLLAKQALLRPLGSTQPDAEYAALEAECLQRINASGIGAQGLGGTVTALAVHIRHQPCHIASLPVAVALNCHAARHAEVTL